ncbi:MAG: hypothetical protein QM784_19380 [Polyangiaceae bacterium]
MLNKVDCLGADELAEVMARHPGGIPLSAKLPEDVASLRERIIEHFETAMQDEEFFIPYAKQGQVGAIYEVGRVLSENYEETGARLMVRALPASLARLRQLFV